MKPMFILMGLLLAITFPADAQLGGLTKKLKKKLQKKTTEQVDFGKLMGSSDMELEESYNYDFSILYSIESDASNNVSELRQMYQTDAKHIGMEVMMDENQTGQDRMVAIIDLERSYFILVNEEDQQAMVFAFDPVEEQLAEQEAPTSNVTFQATGETKMIAGYNCEKYLYSGSDGSGEVWITKDLDYSSINALSYLKAIQQKQQQQGEGDLSVHSAWELADKGFIMEMKGVDADGQAMHLVAQEVVVNADISYPVSEFQVMDMSGLNKLQKGMYDAADMEEIQKMQQQKEAEKAAKKQAKKEKRKKKN